MNLQISIHIPLGFFVQDGNSTEFVLKMKYGHKSLKN